MIIDFSKIIHKMVYLDYDSYDDLENIYEFEYLYEINYYWYCYGIEIDDTKSLNYELHCEAIESEINYYNNYDNYDKEPYVDSDDEYDYDENEDWQAWPGYGSRYAYEKAMCEDDSDYEF